MSSKIKKTISLVTAIAVVVTSMSFASGSVLQAAAAESGETTTTVEKQQSEPAESAAKTSSESASNESSSSGAASSGTSNEASDSGDRAENDSTGAAENADSGSDSLETEDALTEESDADEEADEEKMPAQKFLDSVDGIIVKASVGKGVFPEGTTMKLASVSKSQAKSIAEETQENVADAAGVDITFYNKDGKEIQPADGSVSVKLSLSNNLEGDNFTVVHKNDNGSVSEVSASASARGASFKGDSFSIYVVVGEELVDENDENVTFATYNFYSADGSEIVNTQYVEDGETLIAPSSPEKDGYKFIGWVVADSKDAADQKTEDDVIDFAKTVSVEEKETVSVYPIFAEVHYVFFMDSYGNVAKTKEGVAGDEIVTTDVTLQELDSKHSVGGWYTDKDLSESSKVGDTITLGNENIKLYPEIIEGYYVYYDTHGGTAIDPTYINAGDKVTEPSETPTRDKYTFKYWSATEDGEEYTFGRTINKSITLHAVWEGTAKVKYRINYWGQSIYDYVDTKDSQKTYEYLLGESATAVVGTKITATDKQKGYFSTGGYEYNKCGASLSEASKYGEVTVDEDGTTVLNIYYDRKALTIYFKYYGFGGSSWSLYDFGLQTYAAYTGLYGQTFKQLGYTWPNAGNCWKVDNSSYAATAYLTSFKFNPEDYASHTDNSITLYASADRAYYKGYHYLEQLDGSYTLAATVDHDADVYYIKEAYPGFTASEYRYKPLSWRDDASWTDWQTVTKKDAVITSSIPYSSESYEIRYTRNSYDVVFHYYAADKEITLKYEDSMASCADYLPEKRPSYVDSSYEFKGWYADQGLTVKYDFNRLMPARNVHVYAKWGPKDVSVTANLDMEGSDSVNFTVYEGYKIKRSQMPTVKNSDGETLFNGSSTVVTVPEGYEWKGWATKDNGSYKLWDFNSTVSEPVELYPYYVKTGGGSTESYKVTYNLNGGKGTVEDEKTYIKYADADVQSAKGITAPTGKVFLYWQDSKGNKYYPGDKISVTGNITLKAVYGQTAKTTTLVYKTNYPSDSGLEDKSAYQVVDSNIRFATRTKVDLFTLDMVNFKVPEGYYFEGWMREGSDKVITANQIFVTSNENNEDNVLVAKWAKKKEITINITGNNETVTYDGKEHTAKGYDVTYEYNGETVTELPGGLTLNQVDAGVTKTDAGTYALGLSKDSFEVTGDNVNKYKININVTDGALKINKRSVTVAIKGNTATETYNGREQNVKGYEVTSINDSTAGDSDADNTGNTGAASPNNDDEAASLYTEKDFKFNGTAKAAGTDVGTYDMGLKAADFANTNDNFDVTFDVTDGALTIKKKAVTLTSASADKKYDGKELTAKTVTASGFVAGQGATYTVTGSQLDVGTSKNTFAYELKEGTKADNYTISTVEGELKVTKRSVILKSGSDTKEYDGTALTYGTVGVGGDGFADGEGAKYTVTGTQTLVGTSDNTFTYELKEGTKAGNYNIETKFGTLTVTDRTKPYKITVEANGETDTYDGSEKSVSGFKTLEFTVNTKKYTVSGLTASAKGTDAGEYKAEVKGTAVVKDASGNDVTKQFKVDTKDGKLTIKKRTVTLTSASDSKEYDGTALTNDKVTVSGDGFVKDEGATYKVTGTQTLAGSSDNEFTYELNANTKADNYNIETKFGTLTIKDRTNPYEITVKAKSKTETYDGTEKSVSGFETLEFTENGKKYTVSGLTAKASGTDADTYTAKVEGTAVVKDAGGNDVTDQFKVETEGGKLTIGKKAVTLSTETKSWEYDGKEHSATTVSGIDAIYARDNLTIEATATVKNAGDSKKNVITVTGDTKNYDITKDEGTITVYAANGVVVTITENSGTKTYNGEEQSVTGYEVTSIKKGSEVTELYSEKDFTFSGEATAKGTDAGTYDMELKATDFKNKNGNFKDVTFVIEDGTLTISPKAVTLTSETKSWEYDGETHSAKTVSGTDAIYARDNLTIEAAATVKEAGDSKTNAITVTGDAKNYDITKDEGTISVYAATGIVVTITENSGTKTYNGEEQSVTGYKVTSIQKGENATSLYTENDFTFKGEAIAKGTDAGTYDMELKATDFKNKNGNFKDVTFVIEDGTLTISPKAVTLTSETKSWEYDGETHSAKTVSGTDAIYARDNLTIEASAAVKEAGDSKTNAITVTGDAKNYDITKDEGTISVYAATGIVVTITENSDKVTYNGKEQSVTGYKVTSIKKGSEVTELYTKDDFEFSGEATAKGTDAGTYGMELKATDFKNKNGNFKDVKFVIVDGTLTIEKRKVTLTSASDSKVYDGTELTNDTVTAEGFVQGEGATYTVTGTQTDVGSSKNIFTYVLSANTKEANYDISKVEGSLNVTEQSVTVTIKGKTAKGTYNGEEQSVEGYEVVSIKISEKATADNAGDTGNADGADNASPNNDAKAIAAKDVSSGSDNADNTDNTGTTDNTGAASSNNDTEADSLYTKDDFTFKGTAKAAGTDVGTYNMNLTEEQFENNNKNFTVKFEITDGSLTIDKKAVTLTSETKSWMYDGKAHSATTVSGTDAIYERDNLTIEAAETVKNVSDRKTNAITITGDTRNYDITKDEGSLEITKRNVILTSASATKRYDGTALTGDAVTVSGDGFAKGEGATCTFTGTQTKVGKSDNEFTYELNDGTLAENYDVETVYGTLTVTEAAQSGSSDNNNSNSSNSAKVSNNNNSANTANTTSATGNNDGETTVAVSDNETPLANNVIKNDCILHFLIMLLALLIAICYTVSMKRRQARIFELEEKIASRK